MEPGKTFTVYLWLSNAANNAFKRAVYGMIDFYLEEERILRAKAAAKHVNPTVIEHMVDELWGKVTLYNCYQCATGCYVKSITVRRRTDSLRCGMIG